MNNAINYRRWLFRQVSPYIGSRVFEIGAGIGNYTEFLLDREAIVCLELHNEAAAILKERFSSHSNVSVYQGDITDERLHSLRDYGCDTAICFNVLEHIENHVQALEYIHAILEPDGWLLLIVPAVPAIMGTVDHSLGHYRRYTASSLQAVVTTAGFDVDHIFYMNIIGILGWFWNNRVTRRVKESPAQINFYDRCIVPWLSYIESFAKPPIGLSLVCVAKKRQ